MDHKFKKKFGQNFLKDEEVLNNVITSVDINPDDLVIEIGPGAGALTKKILNKTKKIICYEIDTDLKDKLNSLENCGVKIIYGDFLKQDIINDISEIKYENLYIIANLPYYITTPIIEKIIATKINIKSCVFMVQKEVGDRLSANAGSKNYGSLTVFLNYYFKITNLFFVSRKMFYPEPNVDSSVIKLEKIDEKILIKNEANFFKLIKDSFCFKRKNLRNNLKKYDLLKINKVLEKYDLDLNVRAEFLPIEIFADISNSLK